MSGALVWLDDELVPGSAARVSVADRGFLAGDGVFEALKAVDGVPFALGRHLARLEKSANVVDLPFPGYDVLRHAVARTLAANADRCGDKARIRVTLTAGPGAGIHRSPGASTLVVTADPLAHHPPTAAVAVVPWPRNERSPLVGAKSTSYAENSVIMASARLRGFDEAIMADTQGRVSEGTTCNVLIAHEGELVTPTLSTGCLAGVTRDLAVEWGLAREADLPIEALGHVPEMLLSSTTRDLMPVHRIDERALTAPGKLGALAMAEFARRAASDPEP